MLTLPDQSQDGSRAVSSVDRSIDEINNPAAESAARDMVERLTPLVASENVQQVGMIVAETISQVTTHHSGPLPQAGELSAYNAVDPSFAERIVRMAEREQEHRHALPGEFMKREYGLKSRGQHYALLLAALILLFAAYLAHLGDTDMAGKVAIGTLIGIVGIFVSGRAIDAYTDGRGKPDGKDDNVDG